MVVSLERKERNKEKFKANAKLRRFAIPRLPKCNSLLFLLDCCVMRWLLPCLGLWLAYLRSLLWLTAVRFDVQKTLAGVSYITSLLLIAPQNKN